MIASNPDDCSKATLSEVIQLNQTMKEVSTHFKCALLSYNSKGNLDLATQLNHLCVSCQNENQREDNSYHIPCKTNSMKNRLFDIAEWFEGGPMRGQQQENFTLNNSEHF